MLIKVKYYVDDAEMVRGETPHSEIWETKEVEAASSQEAIDLVVNFLIDQIIQNSNHTAERVDDKINVVDADGNIAEQYYGFTVESPVKAIRTEAGLSRAETARLLEMPIRTLESWEAGVRTPAHWAEKLVIEKLQNIVKNS